MKANWPTSPWLSSVMLLPARNVRVECSTDRDALVSGVRRCRERHIRLGALEVGQKSRRDANLIQIEAAEQLRPVIAHVAKIEEHPLDITLEAEVPLLYVWRAQVGIGHRKIRQRRRTQIPIVLEGARYLETRRRDRR